MFDDEDEEDEVDNEDNKHHRRAASSSSSSTPYPVFVQNQTQFSIYRQDGDICINIMYFIYVSATRIVLCYLPPLNQNPFPRIMCWESL